MCCHILILHDVEIERIKAEGGAAQAALRSAHELSQLHDSSSMQIE